ncbi:hypothetical protein J6590_005235 [Homalodisca vitripennis]|nr:hypothetical protein J6590_005235 [Homalodisca vitripennis]
MAVGGALEMSEWYKSTQILATPRSRVAYHSESRAPSDQSGHSPFPDNPFSAARKSGYRLALLITVNSSATCEKCDYRDRALLQCPGYFLGSFLRRASPSV